MSRIRVPLAVDAQPRLPVGGLQVPVRGVILSVPAGALSLVCLVLPLPIELRVGLVTAIGAAAVWGAVRMRQGVWVGTWLLYRLASPRAGTVLTGGRWVRAGIRFGEESVTSSPPGRQRWLPGRARRILVPPRCAGGGDGLLQLSPGGWRAVLRLEGPQVGVHTKEYERWCEGLVGWLRSCDCPVQLVTVVSHIDRSAAERAFDETLDFEPRDGPLVVGQRSYCGEFASLTLRIDHYAVLAPHLADLDGRPYAANGIWSLLSPLPETARGEAERSLQQAVGGAKGFGVSAQPASEADVAELMQQGVVGAREAAVSVAGAWLDGRFVATLAVTALGPHADHGMVIQAIQNAEVEGVVSLHLLPTRRQVVRRTLTRRRQWLRYVLREGRQDVDVEVALRDTEALQTDLAAGNAAGLRVALAVAVTGTTRSACRSAAERLASLLRDRGCQVEEVTLPGALPLVATSPGGPPLRRSLLLTTDQVLARMLPALGTPFSDPRDPLLGVNLVSGASAYLNVFRLGNHNCVVVGASNSGKSTGSKMLVAEHAFQGVTPVVVDPSPESEWRGLIQLLGGVYHDLGEEALNPLQIRSRHGLDASVELMVTVLSVMAGEEREYVDGRPVRRLAAEEKAWLHRELFDFLSSRGAGKTSVSPAASQLSSAGEPVISDLVDHLEGVGLRRAELSAARREAYERLVLRLAGYTRGQLGRIFNRRSTFAIEPGTPVGIGLRMLNLSMGTEVAPAIAVILTHILDALERNRGRMVVVLDEAHLVTNDRDAGRLLERLVRQARHQFGGVWMLSQKVDEFVSTELGRTLAAVAATKIVLGQEDIVAAQAREVFQLSETEAGAITPPVAGQAVVIAGTQRAVVQLMPSPVLWPWLRTGESARGVEGGAAA
jgi:hypothetical protein